MTGIYGGEVSPDGSAVIVQISTGTVTTGLWCDKCLLPSVVAVPIFVLGEDGPRLLLTSRMCHDCAQPLMTPEDT